MPAPIFIKVLAVSLSQCNTNCLSFSYISTVILVISNNLIQIGVIFYVIPQPPLLAHFQSVAGMYINPLKMDDGKFRTKMVYLKLNIE